MFKSRVSQAPRAITERTELKKKSPTTCQITMALFWLLAELYVEKGIWNWRKERWILLVPIYQIRPVIWTHVFHKFALNINLIYAVISA
jgi:hypothetical protein